MNEEITINKEIITLGQLIKLANVLETGGMIKTYLQDVGVIVNGEKEHRRGRKLYPGDEIQIEEAGTIRSEEHTSELQSRGHLVCRLLLEKKKTNIMLNT